jgi:hypothetical protein
VAVDAVLAVDEAVGGMAVHAVIEELALEVIEPVDAGAIMFEAVAVHTVLAEVRVHDQVAVLRGAGVVDIIAVLQFALHIEGEGGYGALELPQLLEKRPVEIDVAPVRERVPTVAMPALTTVVRNAALRRKLREGPFLTEPAGAWREIEFVAEREPAPLAAVGAEGGRGESAFPSCEHR